MKLRISVSKFCLVIFLVRQGSTAPEEIRKIEIGENVQDQRSHHTHEKSTDHYFLYDKPPPVKFYHLEGYHTDKWIKERHKIHFHEPRKITKIPEETPQRRRKPKPQNPNVSNSKSPNKPDRQRPNNPNRQRPNNPDRQQPNKPDRQRPIPQKPSKLETPKPCKPQPPKPCKPQPPKPCKPEPFRRRYRF